MIKSENMFHYYIYIYYTFAIILPKQINLYVQRALRILYREKKG